MPTVSRKIERLINLTIALLATKRYLTKKEIFSSVDGYEGSPETKERMFERDKDDLRNLGIHIEVGGFDPAFDDEAGYRITSENYQLDIGNISGSDVALLSLAAEAWRGAALDEAAQSALIKLKSIGVESDLDAIPNISPQLRTPNIDFEAISQAIAQRGVLTFTYIGRDLELQNRRVAPYAISTRKGLWYLAGLDLDKNSVRTFRLDRIDGLIQANKSATRYEIPVDFDIVNYLENVGESEIATVDVRKGKAHLLRIHALTLVDKGEWDQLTLSYQDQSRIIESILWHGDDVLVVAPQELRNGVISALKDLVRSHV